MKTIGRILRCIKTLIVSAAVLTAGVLILFCLLGNRFYIVRSGSMEPAIGTGDLIIVNSRYAYERLKEGDIITFSIPNGALVTHRIRKVSEEGLHTGGDANILSDGIVTTRENYLGREWLALPKLGYAASALLGKKGRILMVTAAAAMIIISLFPADSNHQRKGDHKLEKTA